LAGAIPALRAVATRTWPLHAPDLQGGKEGVLLAGSGGFWGFGTVTEKALEHAFFHPAP
jgi:hypothetical protein